MLKSYRLLAIAAAASLIVACAPKKEGETAAAGELTTEAQKFSYAIGVDLGRSLKPVEKDVDLAALRQGLDDQFTRGESKLTQEQRDEIKNVIAKRMQETMVKEREEQAKKSIGEGEAFLAENGKKAGVKTTESGLQYEVLKEGEGKNPTASDNVTVHYKGTLLNGEEFDSSYSRNQPVTFPLGNVIPGWTEGLQLMKPGAKYKFVIPSKLAYGEQGAGAKIGPNSTLIFEVELLSIEAPAK